jgi:hypothetical protein
MNYDSTTLSVTIKDTNTGASATQNYTVNITSAVGGSTGFVGFTGGTGGLTAVQDILTWTYSPTTATASPNAPSGLGANAASATSVSLNWTNNATNQTGFHLDRATDTNFTQNLITETVPASPSSFTDTTSGLAPGGTYYYRLRAFNAAGDSGNSNTAVVSIPVAPPKATNQAVTNVTTNEIDLIWQDNAGHAADSYQIYRAVNGGSFSLLVTLPPTSRTPPSNYTYNDTGLMPGTFYEYHILAVNISGNNDFAGTNATTLTVAPTASAAAGNGSVTVSWGSVPGAVGYNLYRSTTSGSGFAKVNASPITGTSFTDTGLTNGTQYFYQVTAVNANAAPLSSESARSTQVSATPTAGTGFVAHINFTGNFLSGTTPTTPDVVPGYINDIGKAFGSNGGGLTFGWNVDNTANGRDRQAANSPDELHDSLIHMNLNGTFTWSIAVPNGTYSVHVLTGDPVNTDVVSKLTVNGVLTVNGANSAATHWLEGTSTITVTNGLIQVAEQAGAYDKIDAIEIVQQTSTATPPSISTQPASQTVTAGQSVTFSVVATGTAPLSYQWQKNGTSINSATGSSYTITAAQTADAGSYTVVVANTAGSVTSNAAILAVNAGAVVGNGTGLTGQYFADQTLTNLVLTRTDATVNFNWGSGSPDPSVPVDHFSARWTGQVQAQYSETYTFYTESDDGVRLWVNGQLLVDNWTDHAPTENSGTIALVGGQKYDIKMEYYENGGGAVAQLLWSSASTAKQAVPTSQLYVAGGLNFANGFAGATGLTLNGTTTISGNNLQLTDGGGNEAGSAFSTNRQSITKFATQFDFQLLNPNADGMAFVIQGVAANALGPTGGGLGYGPDTPGGAAGIANSIAVKFDLYNNAGEGVDSTGVYTNGQSPTTGGIAPSTGSNDLTGVIDLHSGHTIRANISYDGTTLTVKLTDLATNATATQTYAISLSSIIGGNTAFVGFTAGTGGLTATQSILNWTFTPQ